MTSTVHSLGANDLHSQVTSHWHNHKRIFGTSFSSVPESEVLLEDRSVHAAAADVLFEPV